MEPKFIKTMWFWVWLINWAVAVTYTVVFKSIGWGVMSLVFILFISFSVAWDVLSYHYRQDTLPYGVGPNE